MRNPFVLIILTSFLFACSNAGSGKDKDGHKHDAPGTPAPKDASKKSIPTEAKKTIGNAEIKINYHAPAVRGRVIWGGLVPYDSVWVTGAHNATTLEVSKEFQVSDKTIPAGKFALFTIPGRDEWVVIINKNWNQHLADDYSEKEDLVRVKVKPQPTEPLEERLKYEIVPSGDKEADIIISWEKLRVPFQIAIR